LPIFPPKWTGVWLLVIALFYLYLIKHRFNSNEKLNLKHEKPSKSLLESRLSLHLINMSLSIIIGMNLVFWQAFFAPSIPIQFYNQKAMIETKVMSIPTVSKGKGYTKFTFDSQLLNIQKISTQEPANSKESDDAISWWANKPVIKVSWYLSHKEWHRFKDKPTVGELWRFRVKLKQNHASMNPASRDYEAWLFQNGLVAKATVSKATISRSDNTSHSLHAERLSEHSSLNWRVLRSDIADYLALLLSNSPSSGFYKALLIGDKSQVESEQWELFQKTGTIHLMAISGLHMSIMALIGFWVFKGLWFVGAYRVQTMSLPMFATMGSVLFATFYLFISGGSIPTQRAWIMVVTILGFLLIKRTFQPWSALAMAALLILVWDSKAVLSSGFWLSFYAVSLIFMSLKVFKDKSKWLQVIAMQITLSLGLIPLVAWNFYEVPVYGLFANIVAVPFVTFIGLPLLLLGSLIGLVSLSWGQSYFIMVDWFWQQLWSYLNWLSNLPNVQFLAVGHSILWLLLAVLLLIVTYKGFIKVQKFWDISPWLFSVVLFVTTIVLLLYPYSLTRPAMSSNTSDVWLTVLDVGQGQAIVIETTNHLILYDAGAKWGSSIDAAQIAMLPYLKSQGWRKTGLLIISHSDMDHAGGTESIVQNIMVSQAISGQPKKLNQQLEGLELNLKEGLNRSIEFTQCYAGQSWRMDGVKFEVLSPFKNRYKKTLRSDNDQSCVVKVSNEEFSFLLAGDLSQRGEEVLLKEYQQTPEKLKSDLLVAGHHGSKSSSSLAWLRAVNPTKVVFSAGYLNRYQFPAKEVVERFENLNQSHSVNSVEWWNTACSGAVSFELNRFGIDLRDEARKSQRKWYHHSCLKHQQGIYFQ